MVTPLRIIFCGTPQFAVPALRHLLELPDFEIAAVITQPDRPRGRGHAVSFSAVKETALSANLKIFQPEKIRTPESEEFLRDFNPDAMVIIAYGQIIPALLLPIPKLGWINSHASLLPKYRGAAPIQWAIANGETKTGVTTMRIDAGLDTGEMLLQRETPVGPSETAPELAKRLAEISALLMVETLRALRDGIIQPRTQNHDEASFAPLLKKDDGRIDWLQPAQIIYNRVRGFSPWPGAFTTFRNNPCQLSGQPVSNLGAQHAAPLTPGTIHMEAGRLFVACGQKTLLQVSRVKLEGRKEVSALEFASGAHLRPGEHFR